MPVLPNNILAPIMPNSPPFVSHFNNPANGTIHPFPPSLPTPLSFDEPPVGQQDKLQQEEPNLSEEFPLQGEAKPEPPRRRGRIAKVKKHFGRPKKTLPPNEFNCNKRTKNEKEEALEELAPVQLGVAPLVEDLAVAPLVEESDPVQFTDRREVQVTDKVDHKKVPHNLRKAWGLLDSSLPPIVIEVDQAPVAEPPTPIEETIQISVSLLPLDPEICKKAGGPNTFKALTEDYKIDYINVSKTPEMLLTYPFFASEYRTKTSIIVHRQSVEIAGGIVIAPALTPIAEKYQRILFGLPLHPLEPIIQKHPLSVTISSPDAMKLNKKKKKKKNPPSSKPRTALTMTASMRKTVSGKSIHRTLENASNKMVIYIASAQRNVIQLLKNALYKGKSCNNSGTLNVMHTDIPEVGTIEFFNPDKPHNVNEITHVVCNPEDRASMNIFIAYCFCRKGNGAPIHFVNSDFIINLTNFILYKLQSEIPQTVTCRPSENDDNYRVDLKRCSSLPTEKVIAFSQDMNGCMNLKLLVARIISYFGFSISQSTKSSISTFNKHAFDPIIKESDEPNNVMVHYSSDRSNGFGRDNKNWKVGNLAGYFVEFV